ncbi:putative plastid-lipid-associated protein 3 [Forsythia ovata]|uniref:Plastid-lipid-associated protein 3 n=1 Tax=Forsythia ovata TaxID=205694 RepID=A0ABD1W6Y4_9LAMI
MSLLLNHYPFTLPLLKYSNFTPKSPKPHSISFSPKPRFLFSIRSSYSSYSNDPNDPASRPTPEPGSGNINESSENPTFVDEWGEKSEPEPEPVTKFSGPDPPRNEDEWAGSGEDVGNGSPVADVGGGVSVKEDGDGRLFELKRALLDTVYGSDFGFRASPEVRAEALELVLQLEASNPTPAPTESPELLNGSWVLA